MSCSVLITTSSQVERALTRWETGELVEFTKKDTRFAFSWEGWRDSVDGHAKAIAKLPDSKIRKIEKAAAQYVDTQPGRRKQALSRTPSNISSDADIMDIREEVIVSDDSDEE